MIDEIGFKQQDLVGKVTAISCKPAFHERKGAELPLVTVAVRDSTHQTNPSPAQKLKRFLQKAPKVLQGVKKRPLYFVFVPLDWIVDSSMVQKVINSSIFCI